MNICLVRIFDNCLYGGSIWDRIDQTKKKMLITQENHLNIFGPRIAWEKNIFGIYNRDRRAWVCVCTVSSLTSSYFLLPRIRHTHRHIICLSRCTNAIYMQNVFYKIQLRCTLRIPRNQIVKPYSDRFEWPRAWKIIINEHN